MKNKKIAFSLIEVIIAAWILSLTFFWVYKLIWENTKIISNSSNYTTANSLFLPFKECIKTNYDSNVFIQNNWAFYIWLKNCEVKTTVATGITINNIDYILYWSGTWDNNFDLYIKFDWLKLKETFLLK